jgi:Ca2+-binding EF-hand superfamily protein
LIQVKFKKMSTVGGGGVDFSRAFRRFDKDGSGCVD